MATHLGIRVKLRNLKKYLVFSILAFGFSTVHKCVAESGSGNNWQQDECLQLQTQREVSDCESAKTNKIEEKLTEAYQRILKLIDEQHDPDLKKRMINIERDWIKYKEESCHFEGQMYAGGSLAGQVETQCLAREAKFRTESLNGLLGYFPH